jgi:hypothetical protein
LIVFVFGTDGLLFSQTIEDIKADNEHYLWGEGSGITLKEADKEALAMLISQISTKVESSFTLLKEEMTKSGKSNFNQKYQSVINTYSDATLRNTERIVISDEPDAKVFRYIRRDEVFKVFEERKDKILGFVQNADESKRNGRIADALRYYYWALTLLKSHPDGNTLRYTDKGGNEQLLATWIPLQMDELFSGIDILISKKDTTPSYARFILNILYNDKPVENFDYSYWDGNDWSNIVSAKDGLGIVELYGAAAATDKLKVKAEYIFEGEARIDRELEEVLTEIDPVPFRKSYYTVVNEPVAVKQEEKKDDKIEIISSPGVKRLPLNG